MTPQAFTCFNRLMHYPLAMFTSQVSVTGIAQLFSLLLKQTAKACHMGVMAGETVPRACRLMTYSLLKAVAIVTHKAVNRRQGHSLDEQKQAQGHGKSKSNSQKS